MKQSFKCRNMPKKHKNAHYSDRRRQIKEHLTCQVFAPHPPTNIPTRFFKAIHYLIIYKAVFRDRVPTAWLTYFIIIKGGR